MMSSSHRRRYLRVQYLPLSRCRRPKTRHRKECETPVRRREEFEVFFAILIDDVCACLLICNAPSYTVLPPTGDAGHDMWREVDGSVDVMNEHVEMWNGPMVVIEVAEDTVRNLSRKRRFRCTD